MNNFDERDLIKKEFLVTDHVRVLSLENIDENDKRKLNDEICDENSKKQKLYGKKFKKLKGQNKARGLTYNKDSIEVTFCPKIRDVLEEDDNVRCDLENCKFIHDYDKYLSVKSPEINDFCFIYSVRGRCYCGVSCRFSLKHITSNGRNKYDKNIFDNWCSNKALQTVNSITKDIQISLRKKLYNFNESQIICNNNKDKRKSSGKNNKLGPVDESDVIKLNVSETKKIVWKDKLYLSPLTTVGNLPFRRICKEFGADITCGEMAMSQQILQGHNQEWALLKRHGSENIFGVQICGNNPYVLTKAAQLIKENTDVDFVDINLGCPIDLVYKQGAGSGLLRSEGMLNACLACVKEVLNDKPLTVKTRTGISSNKNIAHNLIPCFERNGVSLITIHGRSREQRYTKLADWNYIETCAKSVQHSSVFGNGDILSYRDYVEIREKCPSISGAMIGRGALIKPWIFQEIKEQKLLDISAQERLDMIKKYVNYGLEHWGSDTKGVETTRRFLLEWLSFLCRYIPVGIMNNPPQEINVRPPYYKGRNDLETLLSAQNVLDWIKISEMFLGPVPDGFKFLPKHKAYAWK